jgi:hypothetical protein
MRHQNFTAAAKMGSMLGAALALAAMVTLGVMYGERVSSAAFFALQLANGCGAFSGRRSVGLVVFLQLAGASARDILRRPLSFYLNTSSTKGGPIRQVP